MNMSPKHDYSLQAILNQELRIKDYWILGLAFFLLSLLLGLLVQLLFLPHCFPQLHAGNGLMINGDWLVYHDLATTMANDIRQHGWSAWELRPHGHAPAGIAAALYAWFYPSPLVVLPLNAFLHTIATLVLLFIVNMFINTKKSVIAILPFLLFPSALTWTSQILKDGFFIIGNLLFLYGFLVFIHMKKTNWVRSYSIWVLTIFMGSFLVWIVRPYGLTMMFFFGLFLFIAVFIQHILNKDSKFSIIFKLTNLTILLALLYLSTHFNTLMNEAPAINIEIPSTPVALEWETAEKTNRTFSFYPYQYINAHIYTLSYQREFYRRSYPHAHSNIDTNVSFHSIQDFVQYTPRAVEIALLAPFPNSWVQSSSTQGASFLKKITGMEMILVYLVLPFFIWAAYRWRKRLDYWLIMMYSLGMMITFTYVICNIGALYRIRYGFLLTIVAISLAFILSLQDKKRPTIKSACSFNNQPF